MASLEHDGRRSQFINLPVSRRDGVPEFTMAPGATRTGQFAFYYCRQLTSLSGLKNSSVTAIGTASFSVTGTTSL